MLALASKPWGVAPGQRFRFEQWAPWLERDHNISLELAPFESEELCNILYRKDKNARKVALLIRDLVRRFSVVDKARKADAVLLFREAALVGPPIIERAIVRGGTPMILDFDDAIWRSQTPRPAIFEWLRGYSKFDELCRLSSAVSAGNAYLADAARPFSDNVHIVPTSIDTDDYRLVPERGDERFTVSWTGSLSTLQHFEFARPALEILATKIPLTVRVICNRPPERPIAGADNEFVPWSPLNEAQEVGDCDAGAMPLPDDEFTRGKCGLKALQFMATGRPVVVSPVGVNRDIVEDGINGYVARTTEEWVDALMRLASDKPKRRQMGMAARKRVEEDYSMRAVAAQFASVVRSVARQAL